MVGLHVYAVLCMLHDPSVCIEYEIVPDDLGPVNSIGYCMKGGAIFAMEHDTIVVGGIEYLNKGVHCKGNPPTNEDIQAWVKSEKERLKRLEPQVR